MAEFIVDTNVAVVANRQNNDVSETCTDNCIKFLVERMSGHILLIDEAGEITSEYAKAIRNRKPYELGARFLHHVINNQYNVKYVKRVYLNKSDMGEYVDFPDDPELSRFDMDDRKFAAISRKANIAVTTAIDSDWVDNIQALVRHNINVNFLCTCDKTIWKDSD